MKDIPKSNYLNFLIVKESGNSLVGKLQRTLSLRRKVGLRECAHCKLIDSGDVALYQVTCPQCGEIPPSRKHRYPNLSTGYVSSVTL